MRVADEDEALRQRAVQLGAAVFAVALAMTLAAEDRVRNQFVYGGAFVLRGSDSAASANRSAARQLGGFLMREFTKSMTSYTWAMSLFGLQQMINIFRPAKATESLINVTKATEEAVWRRTEGDVSCWRQPAKGFVDVTFGVLTFGMFDRGGAQATSDVARQTGEALRQSGRVVSQAVDAVTQTVQSATSAAAGAAQQAQDGQRCRAWPRTRTQPREWCQASPPDLHGCVTRATGVGPMPTQGSGARGAKVKVSSTGPNEREIAKCVNSQIGGQLYMGNVVIRRATGGERTSAL